MTTLLVVKWCIKVHYFTSNETNHRNCPWKSTNCQIQDKFKTELIPGQVPGLSWKIQDGWSPYSIVNVTMHPFVKRRSTTTLLECAPKFSEVGGNDKLSYETSLDRMFVRITTLICTQLDRHAINHNAKLQYSNVKKEQGFYSYDVHITSIHI